MKESQKKKILKHLQEGLSITPMEALREFGCFRLGARICELKEDYPIIPKMIKLPSGKWVARYRLIKVGSVVEYKGGNYYVRHIFMSDYQWPYMYIQKKKYARMKIVHINELS